MSTSSELLTCLAPKFKCVDAAVIDKFIEMATLLLDAQSFGSKYQLAVTYYAAHLLELSQRSGSGAGPVVNERVGNIEVNYGQNFGLKFSESDSLLAQTSWGLQYMAIRDQCILTLTTSALC